MLDDGTVDVAAPDVLAATAGYAVLIASLAFGFILGRRLSHAQPGPRTVVAVVGAGLALVSIPAFGGLGYDNANAALAVQATAMVAVALAGRGAPRGLTAAALIPAFAIAVLTSSWAGGFIALTVAVAALAPPLSPRAHRVTAGLAWTVVLGLAAAQVSLVLSGWQPAVLERPLSWARFVLWSDALDLAAERPLLGHGPGSFADLSSIGTIDPLLTRAHSSVLEVTAELGLVGLAILLAVITAGFVLLARTAGTASLVAIAAWAGLWAHSLVDFVADYPAILLAAGLVVGVASTTRSCSRGESTHTTTTRRTPTTAAPASRPR